MKTTIVFVRHGNTFASGDNVVWVGKQQDLPLVAFGREQAIAIGDAISSHSETVLSVSSGPLIRSKETADLILQSLKRSDLSVQIDLRLDEIDYGNWGGKSSEELCSLGFEDQLKAWDADGIFPEDSQWGSSEEQLLTDTKSFLDAIAHDEKGGIHIAVTSNGSLRYFLRHLSKAFLQRASQGELKVKTGSACCFQYDSSCWSEVFWNVAPDALDLKQLCAPSA